MSGECHDDECPRCRSKNSLQVSSDWKPFDMVSGECLECGFMFYTKCGLMTLKEVNERRKDCYDLPKIKKLIKPHSKEFDEEFLDE